MHKSVDRILITHTGSLPRGAELNDLLIADEAGEAVDKSKLAEKIEQRVAYVMEKQRWAGVDIANDGEQGRVGFQTYVPKRMSGFRRRVEAAVRPGVGRASALHPKISGTVAENRQSIRLPGMRRRA